MVEIRQAGPEDAEELVRLRRLMFAAMDGTDRPGAWEAEATKVARRQLSGPDPVLGAFVIDADSAAGDTATHDGTADDGMADVGTAGSGTARRLAACAVGTVEQRLPAPQHPTGRFAFIFNVCTDPEYRGRGYARATTEALLDWLAAQGVSRVDLHATDEAEALYRSLGFTEHSTALSLDARTFRRPAPEPTGRPTATEHTGRPAPAEHTGA
ncbi:GNAT family N-acetyltransferase [Streptomyces sp. Ru73]|uniref:GNAT family N-acetyltransferase n=1 Tax=Streptomyces sp. Ru73 TaxID=2080748 RepID=UPI000CDD66A2|nr:GNAT family N-acetyltransferase [Streptomyces sp. Ru73]POX40674.1 GNAT family N-acetyltransferase [Streptomyces sp. Ru73]